MVHSPCLVCHFENLGPVMMAKQYALKFRGRWVSFSGREAGVGVAGDDSPDGRHPIRHIRSHCVNFCVQSMRTIAWGDVSRTLRSAPAR